MTSRIIARLTGAPWLIQSEALETIIQIAGRDMPDEATIGEWKRGHERQALATRQGDALGNSPTARVREGVAIIPVAGPIFRYANLFTSFSGATALADLSANLSAAMADGRVKSILMEIDSPGGEVTGLAQAAQMIAGAARIKPVTAFVEGSAMSAAYWLASAAGEIVIDSTAAVGSLGAVVAIQDSAEAQARTGARRYRFVSTQTPNKLLDPTTDAGAARIQAYADRLAAEFLATASANRGMSVEQILAATDGGGLVVGADAVAARLADRVGGFEETLARLAAGNGALRAAAKPKPTPSATGPAPRAITMEPSMKTMPDAPAPAPEATAEQPTAPAPAQAPVAAAEQPEAPAPDSSAPRAALPASDPVAAERARSASILAAQQPGFGALAQLAIAGGWPLEQFTAAQAASAQAVASARTEAAGAAFRDTLPAPVAREGEQQPEQPTTPEAKWEAEFAASADLQAEFPRASTYVAFKRAEADGKVRRITKQAS